jgi:hypothetical protein
MQQPRNILPQEVPAGFANQLREMRDAGDLRLNAVLAAARSKGWRTATLAQVLKMNPTACSKRIERAEPPTADAVARLNLTIAADKMAEIGNMKLQKSLRASAASAFPREGLADAAEQLSKLNGDLRPIRTARRAIERALGYSQPERAVVDDVEIPEPPVRPAAMMNGRQLSREEIDALIALKDQAAKVNGATPALTEVDGKKVKHPLRKASEDYTKLLNDLITKRGFTPYYLAREVGVTHRAITSRLERHGYRTPCPSVQGTPSGVYRGRKIGEQAA